MRIISFDDSTSRTYSQNLRYEDSSGRLLFSVHAFVLNFQPFTFIESNILERKGLRVNTCVGPLDILLYHHSLDQLPLVLDQIPGITNYWKTTLVYSDILKKSETLRLELAEERAEAQRKLAEAEHIQYLRREEKKRQEEVSLSNRFAEFQRKVNEWADIFPDEGITVTETGDSEYALKYIAREYIVNKVGDKFWISIEHLVGTSNFTVRVSKQRPVNNFRWFEHI